MSTVAEQEVAIVLVYEDGSGKHHFRTGDRKAPPHLDGREQFVFDIKEHPESGEGMSEAWNRAFEKARKEADRRGIWVTALGQSPAG